MDPLKPLPPLPPLPPLNAEASEDYPPRKKGARLLGWATVIAVVTALGIGILHAIGAHIFETFWRQLN